MGQRNRNTSKAQDQSKKPNIRTFLKYDEKCEPVEIPASIETLAAALRQNHDAKLICFIPYHPLDVITYSQSAELPPMDWLLVGIKPQGETIHPLGPITLLDA